jgi:hypothetical protein
VVTVRNLTNQSVDVDVEWLAWDGGQVALRPLIVASNRMLQWATSTDVNVSPLYTDDSAGIGSLLGYAKVYASDPRILATSTLVCREADSVSAPFHVFNEIPAYPVGATAEFFQAGMPVDWTPPMAEVPE